MTGAMRRRVHVAQLSSPLAIVTTDVMVIAHGADDPPLFLSRAGARLSLRAADSVVRKVAGMADLELSAHVLRHTCLTGLVRRGTDLVTVAELAGHSRVETTRRYSLPSEADRQQAVDDLQIDF
jgi:site-specific recombinase XerD